MSNETTDVDVKDAKAAAEEAWEKADSAIEKADKLGEDEPDPPQEEKTDEAE